MKIFHIPVTLLILLGYLSCNKPYEEEEPLPTPNPKPSESVLTTKIYTQGAYTVVFKNNDPEFNALTRQEMVATFFSVYPKIVTRFNKDAADTITFQIDVAYNGAAYASGSTATYSAKWMKDHPEDTDIVTHEVTHIVQSYPGGAGPGWITEGIADYCRYKYGVENTGWSLPDYSSAQYYTDSYRVSARFFVWLEKTKGEAFIEDLNAAMHSKTYSDEFWNQKAGKSIPELWDEYSKNPGI